MLTTDSVNNHDNHKKGVLNYAFEAVPMYRRTVSLPDTIKEGDVTTGLGMAALALINLPEDYRDVVGAAKQIKSIFTGVPYKGAYDYKNYQHSFSFFRGTAVDKLVHKKADEGKGWAKWLYRNDKTLAETSLGKGILKLTGGKEAELVATEIKDLKDANVVAAKYEGNAFARLTGRAMRRMTKLGLVALCALEVPKVLKEMDKENDSNTCKQIAKSAINVTSIIAGIGYGGAIGSKYGKGLGSLVGMGAGAILGSVAASTAQGAIG